MDLNDLGDEEGPAPAAEQPRRSALWRHWGSPASIYGTIVYASVVAAASGPDTDREEATSLLIFSVVSIVVFWLAHVYSTALGYSGESGRLGDRVGQSLRHALRESGGMLEAAIVPSVPLLLAALGLLPPGLAVVLALWFAVLMLALLGFAVFWVHTRSIIVCLAGALITGLFGVVVILLKSSLQH